MEQADGTFIKKIYSLEKKQAIIEGWKQSGKSWVAFSNDNLNLQYLPIVF